MKSLSANAQGSIYMMLSMAGYVINDVFMKLVLDDLGVFQSILIRGVFASLFMLLLCWQMGVFKLSRDNWLALKHPLVLWRIFGEVTSTFFFLQALKHMPIANVTAVLQVLPLTLTLCAAIFLGEKVGWRRYLAIMVGLFGVLLIIRPGTEGFDKFSLYALLATAFVTLRDLATRRLPSSTPSILISLITAITVLIMGVIGSLTEPWQPVSQYQFLLLFGAASFIATGYVSSILAMRMGEVSFITMFRYSALIWALLLGYFIFGDVPVLFEIVGAAIVVGSGLFSFYRERMLVKNSSH